MANFQIEVKVVVTKVIDVEASGVLEALAIAERGFDEREFLLDAEASDVYFEELDNG